MESGSVVLMGFKKKSSSARKAHGGIRLSKLSPATQTTGAAEVNPGAPRPQRSPQRHVVDELDPAFAYHEIPDEVLAGTELDLSVRMCGKDDPKRNIVAASLPFTFAYEVAHSTPAMLTVCLLLCGLVG